MSTQPSFAFPPERVELGVPPSGSLVRDIAMLRERGYRFEPVRGAIHVDHCDRAYAPLIYHVGVTTGPPWSWFVGHVKQACGIALRDWRRRERERVRDEELAAMLRGGP